MKAHGLIAALLLVSGVIFAQDTVQVEEDFSMYADAELAGDAKRFCTSKVFDQSPNKLISVGYDYQSPYDLDLAAVAGSSAATLRTRMNRGLRLAANVPVISKTNILLSIGANYWEHFYDIEGEAENALGRSLQEYGLRTAGINFTIFKPLNENNFVLLQGQADVNGNFDFEELPSLRNTRYSGTAVYGWKKHDRLMYGFGISRTYRIGEPNYIPVFLYNYTFPSRKWGVEAVFPARGHLRRNWSPRTMGFFGYELEGQSYRIANRDNIFNGNLNSLELRRSELRIRLMIERSIKDFVWISVQGGFRYNWSFNADDSDFFRGFGGNQDYLMENTIANSFYFNVSLNLVSP